ncbi:MAG: uroporphyrinogen-III synthase [Gammaproteobacteria bacterium]|nr:MAG: uroporphyrinogen-III synthase [Gammaproteobacteria bacterium]TND06434.1 MAG: uroporphyrinogen-III synthase [Gammaproteobacteria bacterium]
MPTERSAGLAGITVLVTRPAHQSQHLCELIEGDGGRVIRFPVIDIAPPADPSAATRVVEHLDNFDIAIFISANAVDHGIDLIRRVRGHLRARLTLAAIGKATAERLEQQWRHVDICPPAGYNSEALLATAAMQSVSGTRIVIFRGIGGRELLGDTLRQRGATVEYADVYQRIKPEPAALPLFQDYSRGNIDCVVVTSNEGLENLLELVGDAGRKLLLNRPLALLSQRGAALATARGFTGPVLVAVEATDEALVDVIRQWWSTTGVAGQRK